MLHSGGCDAGIETSADVDFHVLPIMRESHGHAQNMNSTFPVRTQRVDKGSTGAIREIHNLCIARGFYKYPDDPELVAQNPVSISPDTDLIDYITAKTFTAWESSPRV